MSSIGGKKREVSSSEGDSRKCVGIFEAKVLVVNPNAEEFKDLLSIEIKEDSKSTNYLGSSKDGNITLRLDFWLEEVKTKQKIKATFFLEDREKENKAGTKRQYINSSGTCSWAVDANDLPMWFTKRDYRVASIGEEELYNFLRFWLGNLDLSDPETTLEVDWKKLMRGNIKDISSQIDGHYTTNVGSLATIRTVIKEEETKEYQSVYNKAFLPVYSIKQFRLVDYSDQKILSSLRSKKNKDLKPHERFVLNVTGEYGCRDYFKLKDFSEYVEGDNLVSSDKVINDDDADY